MNQPPLIQTLKAIIERSYGMAEVIRDVAPFIIGDAGYRTLYEEHGASERGTELRPRLLVRSSGPTVRAAVYYPDALVRHLERYNPLAGIGDVNIDAFAILIEELDHLLTLASRAAEGRQVTQLELESHAGVTKYLLVLHFLGKHTGRSRLSESHKSWVRHHLFERYSEAPGEEGERYRNAAGLARRYVKHLDGLSVPQRHAELRDFQRRSFSETCRLVAKYN